MYRWFRLRDRRSGDSGPGTSAAILTTTGALKPSPEAESRRPRWDRPTERPRRRLRPGPEPPPIPTLPDPDAVVVAFVGPELDKFVAALAAYLDPQMPRPDSPARVAGAISTAIERFGGKGRPSVTRSPAGLYSPEYWHLRIDGADSKTREAVGALASGGEPPPRRA